MKASTAHLWENSGKIHAFISWTFKIKFYCWDACGCWSLKYQLLPLTHTHKIAALIHAVSVPKFKPVWGFKEAWVHSSDSTAELWQYSRMFCFVLGLAEWQNEAEVLGQELGSKEKIKAPSLRKCRLIPKFHVEMTNKKASLGTGERRILGNFEWKIAAPGSCWFAYKVCLAFM